MYMLSTPEYRQSLDEYQKALEAEIAYNQEAAEDYAAIARTLGKIACFLLPICLGCIVYCLACM